MRVLLLLAALVCAGCSDLDEGVPPPVQRTIPGLSSATYRHFVQAVQPGAEEYFVQDVHPPADGADWRWTGRRPTFRFELAETQGVNLHVHFGVNGHVLAAAGGALTVTFLVNGRELDRIRYDREGSQRFAKPVPTEWLREGEPTIVTLELDRTLKTDTVEYGLVLESVGFLE
ncbi:MAG: hypothetical protein ACK5AZ_22035 [Bryobacteraceae bacterium]